MGLGESGRTHIKLPSLDVLARVLVGYDNHQLGNLAAHHPLVELRHDLLDVRLDLVVGGDLSDVSVSAAARASEATHPAC